MSWQKMIWHESTKSMLTSVFCNLGSSTFETSSLAVCLSSSPGWYSLTLFDWQQTHSQRHSLMSTVVRRELSFISSEWEGGCWWVTHQWHFLLYSLYWLKGPVFITLPDLECEYRSQLSKSEKQTNRCEKGIHISRVRWRKRLLLQRRGLHQLKILKKINIKAKS